jgi:hypothetical protein
MTDDKIIHMAVRAYVLSIPILLKEGDLIPLISANRAWFVKGGKVIKYMQAAGTALTQGASAYTVTPIQHLFPAMPPGLEHLPGEVDAGMRSDAAVIGQEFLWLAQVLPQGAMGDWGPYTNTGSVLRRQGIAYAQMVRMLSPDVFQATVNAMQQSQPLIELTIYNLVLQLKI